MWWVIGIAAGAVVVLAAVAWGVVAVLAEVGSMVDDESDDETVRPRIAASVSRMAARL